MFLPLHTLWDAAWNWPWFYCHCVAYIVSWVIVFSVVDFNILRATEKVASVWHKLWVDRITHAQLSVLITSMLCYQEHTIYSTILSHQKHDLQKNCRGIREIIELDFWRWSSDTRESVVNCFSPNDLILNPTFMVNFFMIDIIYYTISTLTITEKL